MTVDRHARQQTFEMHRHVIGATDRDDEGRVGGESGHSTYCAKRNR